MEALGPVRGPRKMRLALNPGKGLLGCRWGAPVIGLKESLTALIEGARPVQGGRIRWDAIWLEGSMLEGVRLEPKPYKAQRKGT
jgi:hypothetical protein